MRSYRGGEERIKAFFGRIQATSHWNQVNLAKSSTKEGDDFAECYLLEKMEEKIKQQQLREIVGPTGSSLKDSKRNLP